MPNVLTKSEAVAKFNGGVEAGIAPAVGQTIAAEQSAVMSANFQGIVAHNGWLYGEAFLSATEVLVAQNGYIAKQGAPSDLGFVGAYYHSTCAGLYLQVIGTRIRLTVSNVVGTFTTGELISQAGSGAIGRFIRMDGTTMILALVSGTFNGSGSVAGAEWTSPAIGTQLFANPTFTGAVTGDPGTPPTSWVDVQTTGQLSVAGAVLTFIAVAEQRTVYQNVSVTAGVYAFTIQATDVSGVSPALQDVFRAWSSPSGTTLTYYIDNLPAAAATTFTGTVTLKIVATVTTPGTIQMRIGAGVVGVRTQTIAITNPIAGTSSEPTPVASADVSATATDTTRRFLSRSTDGFAAFYPVLDFAAPANGSSLFRCLIDCGTIDISGTPKKTLIWTTYNQTPDSQVYYNHPDDNDVWTLLFNVEQVGGEDPIRHWHGGRWIPGLGDNEGTLVLFSGDGVEETGLYACEDVADLIANPNTWFQRWGLHLATTARQAHLATQPTDYVWSYGSQSSRTVDLIVDANSEWAYYFPDADSTNGFGGVRQLHRINLATKEIDIPDPDSQYKADGWYGCLSRGVVILTDTSRWATGAAVGGSDEYVRAYAVDNHKLVPIKRWLNTLVPNGTAQVQQMVDWNGWMFGKGPGMQGFEKPWAVTGRGHAVEDRLSSNPLTQQAMPIAINCFPNPTFALGQTGTETRCTATIVTDVLDTEYGGARSLKIVPSATSGAAIVGFAVPSQILDYLRGKWVTLSARYLAPTSLVATQSPMIGFAQLYTGGSTQQITLPKSNNWQTGELIIFVPRKSTALTVWLYGAASGTDTDPVWYSDICLAEGRNASYRNKQYVNLFGI